MRIGALTAGAADIIKTLGLDEHSGATTFSGGKEARLSPVPVFSKRLPTTPASALQFIEQIKADQPDRLVGTNLPSELMDALQGRLDVPLINLRISSVDDLFRAVEIAGVHLNASSAAKMALRGLSYRRRKIEQMTRALSPESRPRVLFLEGLNPLIGAGLWNPQLVALAGGRNLLGQTGMPARKTRIERISILDPDVVFVAANEDEFREIEAVSDNVAEKNLDWAALRAVKHDRIYVAEAEGLFDVAGPCMLEGLELLARLLHPTAHERLSRPRRVMHLRRRDSGAGYSLERRDDG